MIAKSGRERADGRRRAWLAAAGILLLVFAPACKRRTRTPDELTRLAGIKTDKGARTHRYTEIYDLFFSRLRKSVNRVFEIGIAGGGSLEMWRDYFPKATIYGIDIYPKTELESDRIKTFVADQADRSQLAAFIDKFGGYFDIIIDDGGHAMDQQQISAGYLFKYVRPGGFYVIEDVHTSLPSIWSGFGVEPGGGNSTLAMIENFIADGRIESRYLSGAEAKYLTRNIEYCNLVERNNRYHSMACILKKRATAKR